MKFAFEIALLVAAVLAEPNPPTWDTTKVFVVKAGDNSAQDTINRVLAENGGH